MGKTPAHQFQSNLILCETVRNFKKTSFRRRERKGHRYPEETILPEIKSSRPPEHQFRTPKQKHSESIFSPWSGKRDCERAVERDIELRRCAKSALKRRNLHPQHTSGFQTRSPNLSMFLHERVIPFKGNNSTEWDFFVSTCFMPPSHRATSLHPASLHSPATLFTAKTKLSFKFPFHRRGIRLCVGGRLAPTVSS